MKLVTVSKIEMSICRNFQADQCAASCCVSARATGGVRYEVVDTWATQQGVRNGVDASEM